MQIGEALKSQNPKLKNTNLVLVGGGHSHAIALLMFGKKPIPGLNLSLISDIAQTPYSGMLPGHIAGFYTHDECHIDLKPLSQFAGAKLYIERVTGIDLANNKVICQSGKEINFDMLSVDIGSNPTTLDVLGAAEYAIKAKPIAKLLEHWYEICREFSSTTETMRIAIVGAGAGGVELALSMQANLLRNNQGMLEIHLLGRDTQLMPSYHPSAGNNLKKVLLSRGIKLHLGENVSRIEQKNLTPNSSLKFEIICQSGLTLECNKIFWVTQASAPQWVKATEIKTDEQGFILVNDALQSLSHPNVFAAGDIASMFNHPLPKAGVFAVRQGKPLFENLNRYLCGKPLTTYRPQKQYLSLIGTGDGKAIAIRGSLTLPPHQLLWYWKDWIDKAFMKQFSMNEIQQ
ncbi:MAG: FAD-dependent oxidoreductase [Scytonematopsis contorta HA4267-MV1]|jgi:selenide,water dikinase|nr:FAD-dependent oxidoreductase [Scytonematopsis contorta HA4267-MV1]